MFDGGDLGDRLNADSPVRESRADGISASDAGAASAKGDFPTRLFHIPPYWRAIGPALAVAMLPALVSAGALPGPAVALFAGAAIVLGLFSGAFIKLERERARTDLQRGFVMAAAAGLPMLLYASAATLWAQERGDPLWIGAVGMIALASGAASLLLARRPVAMLTAIGAAWLPLALSCGVAEVWLMFECGFLGGALLLVHQGRITREAMARHEGKQRVQQRAFDILADYERTGHGWFWETDRVGRLTYLSANLGEVFGHPVQTLYGRALSDLFSLDVSGGETTAPGLSYLFSARTDFRDLLVSATGVAGDRWWSISGSAFRDENGAYLGFRGFGWDQTEKRRSQERSSRLALYDSLTGVANRLQISQSLETILGAQDAEGRNCALFLIDLDRFKQVNDTLGHPVGDAVLKQAAERLRLTIDGAGRVGRLGGDEFQIVLPGRHRNEDLAPLAGRIIDALSQPYAIDGKRAVIGASVGVALAPQDGATSEALVRNADLALYAAKDAGRGRFHFYAPDLHNDAEERRELERDLWEAIASGGLDLWYQPVIHTATETVAGFEALLRWNHPRLGRISPAVFVPIAEDAGLMAPLGEWALRTACRDLANWPETVRVAVNLSPLQFANPALPGIVTNALAAAQVAPSRLELEITESVFFSEDGSAEAMFASLKRLGVRLVLDDFGTGYVSLAHIEAAPLDRIKIDQSFMRGAMDAGSRNGPILASVVGLAAVLGMETTAEGVETPEELELARSLGCSHVQGYVYEAPMSLDETIVWLGEGGSARMRASQAMRLPRDPAERRITVEVAGERHAAAIRDVAISGAMIEVIGDMTLGTEIEVQLSGGGIIPATVRWSDEDRIGVDFAAPLSVDKPRRLLAAAFAEETEDSGCGQARAG